MGHGMESRAWRRRSFLVLVIALSICLPLLPPPSEAATFIDHPILVEGDDGFLAAGFLGNGTHDSPYVLSEVRLDASYEPHGIRISNTTAHFMIVDCTVHDAASADRDPLNLQASGSGILLYNVSNGQVLDCLAEYNVRGITVVDSRNVTVASSRLVNNLEAGVHFQGCLDGSCGVYNSTFQVGDMDDGVLVEDCHGVTVEGNAVQGGDHGVRIASALGSSSGNLVIGNAISGQAISGIFMGDGSPTGLDLVQGNTVQVPGGTGILVSLGTDEQIVGNEVQGCLYGIRVAWTGNEVRGNLLSNNTRGIVLEAGADHNTVLENIIADGAFGIEIGQSQGNQVLNNTLLRIDRESSSVGIYLGIGEVKDALVQGNWLSLCNVGIRAASTPALRMSGIVISDNVVEGSLRQGAYLISIYGSLLLNNSFRSGGGSGIFLGADCLDLLLDGNLAADNLGYGLEIRGAVDCTVTGNLFDSNALEGVYLEAGTGNVIHGNAFLFNKDSGRQYSPLRPQAHCAAEGNSWSLGSGNLWADWLSPDVDEDGVVDLPYDLSGGAQDPLPLTGISGVDIPADIAPPQVVDWSPRGSCAEHDSVIEVTFSEDMDQGSVWVTVNGEAVNGTWDDRTLMIDLDLEFGTGYEVAVSGSDLSGNSLSGFGWNFTTEGPNATVSGRVVDEGSAPLEGVMVSWGEQQVSTSSDGGFSLVLPPGNHVLNLSRAGYLDLMVMAHVEAGEDLVLEDTVMRAAPGNGGGSPLPYIGLAAAALILVSLVVLAMRRRK